MKKLAPLCLIAVTAVGLPSQTTLLVGPGGLPQIRDALAIAAPGDVIEVQPGTYSHFTASVGVTIRAQTPRTVTVQFDPAFAPPACLADPFCAVGLGVTKIEPPAAQTVHVVGLDFAPNTYAAGFATVRHRVAVTGGAATFDDCTIRALETQALSIGNALVHLQSCLVTGNGALTSHALGANGADLIAVDCTIVGNPTMGLTFPGDAMRLTDCTLKASGCQLAGGTPFFGGVGGAALRTDGLSRIWISDSTLTGGGSTCAVLGTPAIGRIDRSTVTPTGASCGTLLVSPVVGVERPVWPQSGGAFTVVVHTEPFSLVAIHASPGLATIELPGLFEQPIALDLTAYFLAGVFASDANGDVTASWNLPAGMFVDTPIWLEPMLFVPGAPFFQLGPVVGGVIR